jgi:hypothetical protein
MEDFRDEMSGGRREELLGSGKKRRKKGKKKLAARSTKRCLEGAMSQCEESDARFSYSIKVSPLII